MKRRLNILCAIVLLVMGWSVGVSLYYMGLGMTKGVQMGMDAAREMMEEGNSVKLDEVSNMQAVSLFPKFLGEWERELFTDSIRNEKTGRYVPMAYSNLMVSVPVETPAWQKVASSVMGFLVLVANVWALVLFIRIVVSVNRSDIFNWRNVRRLRRLGILLIVGFVCVLLSEYMALCNLREAFALEAYDLALPDSVKVTNLLLGLISLIVAEVFAIGLKMKEEQDLTI
ncbi:DUF2975 domain-containing protein [Bacteroides ndongoniae]|uniref:DUF2975 domain-containing protein n=1 Tax=Bacteroides ndongoniae TaxID=1903262 RepID=UPI0008D9934E|nr:DUF2975 domain-containing protein [Bacteroides ndongoniae]